MALVYGAEAATTAVRKFLEKGTHGGAGSPAETFNEFLARRRAELSITTANLPDVAEYEDLWARGSQATTYPYLSIAWESASEESGGANSRMVDHSIATALFVLGADIAGAENEVSLAAIRYADALRAFFFRRVPIAEQGWTLNNGGDGEAQGRVIRCEIENQDLAVDDATPPNWIVLTRLRVRMQENY